MPYITISQNGIYKTVYIWPQIVDIGTIPFCFVCSLMNTCSVFMCFIFTHSWLIRDTSIVHLNTRCFNHCLYHLELGVLQQLKLLQWMGMIHRSKIVHESYSSHDMIKEQCCLLCIVFNFRLS